MGAESSGTLPGIPEKVEIRLELKFRKQKKRLKRGSYIQEPVQKLPLTVYVKVTNISSKISKGFRLENAKFEFNSHNIVTAVDHDVQIPSLNPKESVEVELDSLTFNVDGSCWFCSDISPESEEQEIFTFQYDQNHNQDAPYGKANKWGCIVYVEGKASALQAKTNEYILFLTLVTVLEAVFGLTNILKAASELLGTVFSLIAQLFWFLASLI